MAIEQGWAIQGNNRVQSQVFVNTIRYVKREAIEAFLGNSVLSWKHYYRRGWRAIRVLITDELWRGDVQPASAGVRLCCVCGKTWFLPEDPNDCGAEDTCALCAKKMERGEI